MADATSDKPAKNEGDNLDHEEEDSDTTGSPPKAPTTLFTSTASPIRASRPLIPFPPGDSPVIFKGQTTASSETLMSMPPPLKPPRNSHAGAAPEDEIRTTTTTAEQHSPVASPSSSKATVKTGVAQQQQQKLQGLSRGSSHSLAPDQLYVLHAENTMENSSGSSMMTGSGTLLRSSGRTTAGSLASPKMSPAVGPRKNPGGGLIKRQSTSSTHSQPPPPQPQQQQPFFSKLDHPPLPLPRKARRCPLFCCFYAEFDNVVGPKIIYESPKKFMEQDTDVSLKDIHKLLGSNFDRILSEQNANSSQKEKRDSSGKESSTKETTKAKRDTTTTPASAANSKNSPAMSPVSTQGLKSAKSVDSTGTMPVTNTAANMSSTATAATATTTTSSSRRQQPSSSSSVAMDTTTQHSTASSSNLNNAATATKDPPPKDGGGSAAASIFESTCDFIITGSELTGNIVNLSAFNMHLLTRPTVIQDERYERNSLLFCVGFVLRRTEDPRPFRPLLSKLALTLKRMEMESHFLSKHSTREQIQPLLDRILVSLNCTQWETNLVVDNTLLNLKLFHPPKYPASPVKDHSVPILLRRDWQVQMYDWDLAINWVVLHIDGVANLRQISNKAEVDLEMVRACLRVLKHHGVISVVDMFFYSNRYQSTKRAASMLSGQEAFLLHEAAEYVIKRPPQIAPPPYSNLMANPMAMSPPSASPSSTLQEHYVRPPVGSPGSPIMPASFPPELSENAAAAAGVSLLGSSLKYAPFATSYQSHDPHLLGALRREDQRELKMALAELYCAFNRDMSFGDLWVALAAEKSRSQSFDTSVERNRSDSRDQSRHSYQQQQQQGTSYSNQPQGNAFATAGESSGTSGSEGSGDQGDAAGVPPSEYYFERLRKKSSCAAIDWRAVFDMIDHRRFVSFGLVNGLLDRVHNYPFALETASNQQSRKKDFFFSDDETTRMVRVVATMMDGLHCDDHIVSVFEKPISELIELVEKAGGKKVLSTYSIAPEWV